MHSDVCRHVFMNYRCIYRYHHARTHTHTHTHTHAPTPLKMARYVQVCILDLVWNMYLHVCTYGWMHVCLYGHIVATGIDMHVHAGR